MEITLRWVEFLEIEPAVPGTTCSSICCFSQMRFVVESLERIQRAWEQASARNRFIDEKYEVTGYA